MNDKSISLHGFVSGHVQGVFFRAETQRKAATLGLDGWVRNVKDGRVELLICGKLAAVEEMRIWLLTGPKLARVADLDLSEVSISIKSGFEILP